MVQASWISRFQSAIDKHKLAFVMLAALLTTAGLMLLVRLPDIMNGESQRVTVSEHDGVYDLTGIGDLDGTAVLLAPPSTYYPGIYLTPGNTGSVTPQSVDRYKELRADFLSQRFLLKMPDDSCVYALTFKVSGRHALRVYVNGTLAGQTGTLGTSKQTTEVWENNITCYAAPRDGKMEILLNSAQFYHYKRGAALAELSLHKEGPGTDMGLSAQSKGLLVMGALLSAAILLFCLFLLQPGTKATLYFALACLSMVLRECLQSQAWTYLSFISGKLSFMLEYLSVVLLTVFLTLYLAESLTGRLWRTVKYTVLAASCIYGAFLLYGDTIFYTSVLRYYQLLLVVFIVLGVSGLFWAMRSPTGEQAAALYGIAVFYLAAVGDIVMYSRILGNSYPNAPVSEAAMLVFVVAQAVSLFLANNRRIAEAKEAEQKLAAERDALESLNRMKTEFLGNVSHELKTPLTVMSGYAQTTRQLAEQPGGPEAAEVSRRMKLISSEAERLSLMVGQILDVTRMEEGRMAMERVPCYADEIIHGAIETHYPMLNKNANRLEIRIEAGLPAVSADPVRISQVIVNLVSNSVRFTVNGLITVSARREDAHILICVADTGSGISQERLAHIFERYSHGKKSGVGQDTGTGLGLYICKHIVEQHGGRIWLESEEGRGTSVFFTLPLV